MEPFFDGGLFELLVAIGIGSSLNFIFKRKYLLMLYSIASIMATILLFFTTIGEIHQWLIGVNSFNSILLIALLWKQKLSEPNKSLIDTDKYIDLYVKRKAEIKRILRISED
jgi:hypothetical protein